MPIIGNLQSVPNMIINAGHGGHGLSISFFCAKAVQSLVEGKTRDFIGEDLWQLVEAKRCLV